MRELNQNPSKAVARVRAGVSIVVTDRGKPILRMVPEVERPGRLHRLVTSGEATAPAEQGMPDLIPDLVPESDSLTEILIADRRPGARRLIYFDTSALLKFVKRDRESESLRSWRRRLAAETELVTSELADWRLPGPSSGLASTTSGCPT